MSQIESNNILNRYFEQLESALGTHGNVETISNILSELSVQAESMQIEYPLNDAMEAFRFQRLTADFLIIAVKKRCVSPFYAISGLFCKPSITNMLDVLDVIDFLLAYGVKKEEIINNDIYSKLVSKREYHLLETIANKYHGNDDDAFDVLRGYYTERVTHAEFIMMTTSLLFDDSQLYDMISLIQCRHEIFSSRRNVGDDYALQSLQQAVDETGGRLSGFYQYYYHSMIKMLTWYADKDNAGLLSAFLGSVENRHGMDWVIHYSAQMEFFPPISLITNLNNELSLDSYREVIKSLNDVVSLESEIFYVYSPTLDAKVNFVAYAHDNMHQEYYQVIVQSLKNNKRGDLVLSRALENVNQFNFEDVRANLDEYFLKYPDNCGSLFSRYFAKPHDLNAPNIYPRLGMCFVEYYYFCLENIGRAIDTENGMFPECWVTYDIDGVPLEERPTGIGANRNFWSDFCKLFMDACLVATPYGYEIRIDIFQPNVIANSLGLILLYAVPYFSWHIAELSLLSGLSVPEHGYLSTEEMKNLTWLSTLERNEIDSMMLPFAITHDNKDHDLGNGIHQFVTHDNRSEFVDAYKNFRQQSNPRFQFMKIVREALINFFARVNKKYQNVHYELFFSYGILKSIFRERPIMVDTWKKYTQYSECDLSTNQITWFWEFVSESEDNARNVFKFSTGMAFLQDGFLSDDNKYKICLVRNDKIPEASTCFITLYLPKIDDKQDFLRKICIAITDGADMQNY